MKWNALLNGFSELIVIILLFTLLFYIIYSINLKLLQTKRGSFLVNEAMSIYMFGAFVSLAIVFQPMLLSLNGHMTMISEQDSYIILQPGILYVTFKIHFGSTAVILKPLFYLYFSICKIDFFHK